MLPHVPDLSQFLDYCLLGQIELWNELMIKFLDTTILLKLAFNLSKQILVLLRLLNQLVLLVLEWLKFLSKLVLHLLFFSIELVNNLTKMNVDLGSLIIFIVHVALYVLPQILLVMLT